MTRFLRDRDELQFRALYRAHTPALYLFAMRILGRSPQDAEEAVQEMWIRAISHLSRFRWESTLRTWLCGIAWNCCREIIRRRGPRLEIPEPEIAEFPIARYDIERCIASLPDGCREVLVLHDIEGYTHKEIAASMEISEGTSKSQLFRARSKLRAFVVKGKPNER